MRRLMVVGWAVFCTYAAFDSAARMLITHAIQGHATVEEARAESRGIERMRNSCWSSVWSSSGLLAVNSWAVAALVWRRPPVTAPA